MIQSREDAVELGRSISSTASPPKPPPSNSTSKSHEVFTHQPLDPSQQQIRLMKLLPAPGKAGKICLEIRHFEQSTQPYRALSYTWDDTDNQRDILINSKRFSVQASLWSFLETQRSFSEIQHVGEEGYRGWYWIDALCIDQSNALERNHQVRLMTQIYEGDQRSGCGLERRMKTATL